MKCSTWKYLLPLALVLCLSALLGNAVYAGTTGNERMSDSPYGPPMTECPSGTTTVYIVFDYTSQFALAGSPGPAVWRRIWQSAASDCDLLNFLRIRPYLKCPFFVLINGKVLLVDSVISVGPRREGR